MFQRATKIIATIGPACQDDPVLTELILAGVNVARFNFSHGTHEVHGRNIQRLREHSSLLSKPLCILQDLQGPKIRIGQLVENIDLVPGDKLVLTTRSVMGTKNVVSVDFPQLASCVIPGGRILLDDGNIELRILDIHRTDIFTEVVTAGVLKPNKGVNLPGVKLPVNAMTAKDEADLAFGLSLKVDAVALSFVRTPEDIHFCRRLIAKISPERADTPIIAKLERPEALDNLDEIISVADGVMVARGDLGVEMQPEIVPIAQKRIIVNANRLGKIVITATQMLDSMIHNPRPTRAEASDVANAILDGTDAVMLSGETATGKYPVKAVQTMDAIICQAEEHMGQWGHHQATVTETFSDDTFFTAQAACALAHDRNVAAVAVFTHSGRTAQVIAKLRPTVPILAFTTQPEVFSRLPLLWGVQPHLVPHADSIEEMLSVVDKTVTQEMQIQPGQQVVMICGYPIARSRPTNLALLYTIGSNG